MHYRHSYHAGNFADVFKHLVLCALLDALNRKDKPWCYLETHAGAGAYDLSAPGATRTGEWHNGIEPVYGLTGAPPALAAYLDRVREFNGGGTLRRYPGSPWFARQLARAGDRLVLCEKTEAVAADLKLNFSGERRAVIHLRDGYEAHALLPPKENRGLVLVDPPFERPDEFDAVAEFFRKARSRFAGGVYALWYPVKNRHAAGRFVRRVAAAAVEGLALEFETGAPGEGQMRACGMLVANPPYRFRDDIEPALQVLVRELAQGPKAAYRMTPLTK